MATWSSPVTARDSSYAAYNYTDLSRVEENTQYLSDLFNTEGYTNNVVTKYPWTTSGYSGTFFNENDDARYLTNIQTLADFLPLPTESPSLPANMDDMTRAIADNIEKVQYYINDTIIRMQKYKLYAKFSGGASRSRQFLQRGS